MTHIKITYKYMLVILIGLAIFLFDLWELTNPIFIETMLFVVSVGKSAYFIWFTFFNIKETASREFYFHEFVPFVALTVLLIILSFGLDYYSLYHIRSDAFSGSLDINDNLDTFITFFYFSVTTFTTAGLGEIIPQTTSARVFVMLELIIAFFFTILVIANISQIRESISKKAIR